MTRKKAYHIAEVIQHYITYRSGEIDLYVCVYMKYNNLIEVLTFVT